MLSLIDSNLYLKTKSVLSKTQRMTIRARFEAGGHGREDFIEPDYLTLVPDRRLKRSDIIFQFKY